MNIKRLFNLESTQEKVYGYKNLLVRADQLALNVDQLANEFAEQGSIFKSISILENNERKDASERYNAFLKEHAKKVSSLQREKSSIEKSLAKYESDEDVSETLKEVKALHEAKRNYKEKKISKSIYNDIIKAKSGKVRYADVLLFRGEKMLVLQRAGEMGGHTDQWCIPGGHVDMGEDYREAACRELFEETGIEVPADTLIPVAVAENKDCIIHYFMGHVDDDSPTTVLIDSEEEIGAEWIYPATELENYEFIFDMKDNIKRILGLEVTEIPIRKIQKAFSDGIISSKVFKAYCDEHPDEVEKANNKTYFSHKERKDLAKEGEAMPNGKYPIRNAQDLKDAIRLVGASSMPESEVKAWIKKRAKALGLIDELPESWDEKKEDVEKTMDCDDVNAICKEHLDDEEKKPDDDGIEKTIEEDIEGFSMLINFNDLDQADMFKSLIDDLKKSGKLDIESIETIEKSKVGVAYGTIRVWHDREYVKTVKGWRPVPKKKDPSKEASGQASEAQKKEADPEIERVRNRIESLENMRRNLTPSVGKEKRNEIRNEIIDEKNRLKELLSRTKKKDPSKEALKKKFEEAKKIYNDMMRNPEKTNETSINSAFQAAKDLERQLKEKGIEKSLEDDVEKAKDFMYGVFAEFANFLEGAKTRTKNIHWGELDNSKHVYLDDLEDTLSDYEDKVMEAGQSKFGRFKEGEINGEIIKINDPIEFIDLIIERSQNFYEAIKDNLDYVGEMSWVEDFLGELMQTKYRLQMH